MKMVNKYIRLAGLLLVVSAIPGMAQAGGAFQTAEVENFGNAAIEGGAMMTRAGNSIHLRVAITGLSANTVYSVWFLIWNNTNNCESPNANGGLCTPPGGGGSDPEDAVRHAAGFITGADGAANFSAWLDAGDVPDGLFGFGKLTNSGKAEVHAVILPHGAPVTGIVGAQLSTPFANCGGPCPADAGFVFPPAK